MWFESTAQPLFKGIRNRNDTMSGTEIIVGSWAAQPQQTMQTSGVSDPAAWLIESLGGGSSDSGIRVNQGSVLGSGPVYQAVTLISSALAMLPIDVFRSRVGASRKKTRDVNHPIHRLFNVHGNDEMTPFIMRQTILGWMLLHGNGLAAIERVNGVPVGLYPLQPGSTYAERLPESKEFDKLGLSNQIVYRVTLDNGTTTTLFRDEIFHLKMFGNGLWSYSPLSIFANLFGKGLAMNKFQGKNFANAARPSGLLEKQYGEGIPSKISPEARANLRREWEEMQTGLDNTGKVAILVDGLRWVPMSVNAEDAQMIESLQYHREEVAAVYNIPKHKLGAMQDSAVRANIEEQSRAYVEDCLQPISTMFEQECSDKLCSEREKEQQTCVIQHDYSERLKADHKTRSEANKAGRDGGWLSANDVREKENLPDLGEKGDIYLIPSNMANAETGEPFSASPTQSEPEPDDDGDDEVQENLLTYARTMMHSRQQIESKALRRAFAKQSDFPEFCERYYSTFSNAITEPLGPLTTVSGFVSSTELDGIVQEYVTESFDMVRGAQTADQLLDTVAAFPQRVDQFLSKLRV